MKLFRSKKEAAKAWGALQTAAHRIGGRFYGDGGTIHSSNVLDIEVGPDGNVVAVWFRCAALPFRVANSDKDRVREMRAMYQQEGPISNILGLVLLEV